MSLIISPPPTVTPTLGTITRVQSASANTGNANNTATSLTVTFGANLTVGNIVVVVFGNGVATIQRMSGPGGTQQAFVTAAQGQSDGIGIGFLPIYTAGTDVTVTLSPTTTTFNGGAIAVEYSGVKLRPDASGLLNAAAGATSPVTSNLVTNGSNELLIAGFCRGGAQASEATGWLTAITNNFSSVLQTSSFINTAADRAVAFCERIVTSAGTYSCGGTQASGTVATLIAGYISD